MKKLYVLIGTLFICGLVGCGQDPNEEIVSRTISTLQNTTRGIDTITGILNTEVKAAKDDPTKSLDEKNILKAKVEAENLKKWALELQQIKSQTDNIRDSLTKEQREALANKHKQNFQAAANELYNSEKKLESALKDAESLAKSPASKSALNDLRKALETSQKEFAVLTKRQS